MGKKIRMAVLLLLAILICFVLSIPIVNNITVSDVAKGLKALPLPENTEYIESLSKAGKLVGSGNGMQYFGCILIKSGLSQEELTEYYSDVTDGAEYLSVAPQAGQIVEGIEHDTLTFQTQVNSSDYYIVSNWGKGFGTIYSELDVRGY